MYFLYEEDFILEKSKIQGKIIIIKQTEQKKGINGIKIAYFWK